jgi:short-subunit dehydrogenase
MAKPFTLVGTHAIAILARLAAKRAVQEELRSQGVRVTLVKPADIAAQAKVYLEQHPELFQQALERAKQMGLIA